MVRVSFDNSMSLSVSSTFSEASSDRALALNASITRLKRPQH
jgi:hypothetical protein